MRGLPSRAGLFGEDAPPSSGAWKGQFEFNGTPVPLTFELKVNGESLTGAVAGSIGEFHDEVASKSFELEAQVPGDLPVAKLRDALRELADAENIDLDLRAIS